MLALTTVRCDFHLHGVFKENLEDGSDLNLTAMMMTTTTIAVTIY